MSYSISLNGFEGPMDLLLHLIQKNKIDIYDIPISEITSQYLIQIETWRNLDMEVASDFIVMAARLLEIKSRMLLPKNEDDPEDEETLKAKLLKQILEYKIFKEISAYLGTREERELQTIYKDPEYIPMDQVEEPLNIDPIALMTCFKTLLLSKEEIEIKLLPPQQIVKELFSIEEKIEKITQVLVEAGEEGVCFSKLLYPEISREEVVVTLLALLEMVKTNGLRLEQNRVFIDFQIKKEGVIHE